VLKPENFGKNTSVFSHVDPADLFSNPDSEAENPVKRLIVVTTPLSHYPTLQLILWASLLCSCANGGPAVTLRPLQALHSFTSGPERRCGGPFDRLLCSSSSRRYIEKHGLDQEDSP